ncbi:MAG: glycoside hydrolase 105 family protein [Lachnospiraceae bacterium]|nr:glycoside hydrolase 105 family protein [Lachnospiraceae bacterium]
MSEEKKSVEKRPLFYAKASVETMMRKFKGPDLPPRGRFHYHQGVFLSGVYKTYQACGDERYFQYVKSWVDSCIDENGVILDCDKTQLDDQQAGILLYPLLDRTGDAKYKKALDAILPVIREFPRNEAGGFWHKHRYPDQMWLDGLYMAGPVTAEYGKRFNVPEDLDLVAQQALLMEEKTKDPRTGLLYHAWDCSKKVEWADPETGLSPEFWGRSIGWVPVAVLDDLDFLPETHPSCGELRRLVKELLEAVCRYQSQEGRWYQVVDKPEGEGNWLETSCSCLFVAAICKAVRQGILPEEYLSYARKGYEGVINSLEWDGEDLLVGGVCVGTGVGNYDHYINRPTSVNDLHGVGAFLIMCTECEKVF